MKRVNSTLLTLLLGIAALPLAAQQTAAAREELWSGKRRTDRSIEMQMVVDGAPSEVYELWLSPEGLRRFFAPAARIDPVVGGRYEMVFDPQGDPDGERDGTKGARILEMQPGAFLAFEWKGREAMKEMNTRPLPTWVELSFTPLEGETGKTQIAFAHHGFGSGGTWDIGYVFFKGAWRAVLDSLRVYCARLHARPAEEETVVARLATHAPLRGTGR
jgi:uncharacterized protein YndB with AHSA1/START domain